MFPGTRKQNQQRKSDTDFKAYTLFSLFVLLIKINNLLKQTSNQLNCIKSRRKLTKSSFENVEKHKRWKKAIAKSLKSEVNVEWAKESPALF